MTGNSDTEQPAAPGAPAAEGPPTEGWAAEGPPTDEPAAEPQPRTPAGRSIVLPVIVVVVVAAIAVGIFVFRDRLTGAAQDLVAGDCIDLPTTDEFAEVQHRPCTEPHDAEVFVVGNVEDDSSVRPSDAVFEAWVSEQCLGQAFTDYTGQTYEAATEIGVGYFSPSFSSWSDGDREVTCYLAPVDGEKVSTSYKKAG